VRFKVRAIPAVAQDPPVLSKEEQGARARHRAKRREAEAAIVAAGRRRVDFVIEVALWDRFVATCCTEARPNVVFGELIARAVAEARDSGTAGQRR